MPGIPHAVHVGQGELATTAAEEWKERSPMTSLTP